MADLSFFGEPAGLFRDNLLEAAIAAAVLVEPELVVEGRGVGSVIRIGVCSRRSLSDDFFCSKDE